MKKSGIVRFIKYLSSLAVIVFISILVPVSASKYKGYVNLSSDFSVDKASVEKDIQNAISSAFLRGNIDVLYTEFGETLDENKGKPTNKQFFLTALERIK